MPPVTDGFTVFHAAFVAGNLVTVRSLLENCVDFGSALDRVVLETTGGGGGSLGPSRPSPGQSLKRVQSAPEASRDIHQSTGRVLKHLVPERGHRVAGSSGGPRALRVPSSRRVEAHPEGSRPPSHEPVDVRGGAVAAVDPLPRAPRGVAPPPSGGHRHVRRRNGRVRRTRRRDGEAVVGVVRRVAAPANYGGEQRWSCDSQTSSSAMGSISSLRYADALPASGVAEQIGPARVAGAPA